MKQKFGIVVTILCLLCWTSFAQINTIAKISIESTATFVPFVDQLQNGEHFTITISSIGCFHNRWETMVISKSQDQFFITINEDKKRLKKEQIAAVKSFEQKLQNVKNAGCTTVDHYTVTYGTITTKYIDGSCTWNGGSTLKKQLAGSL